jgi:hypothetical protein
MLKKIEKSMVMGLFLSLMIGGMILSLQPASQVVQPAIQVGYEQSATVAAQSGDGVVVMEAGWGWGWLKRAAACAWCLASAFTADDACYYCAHNKKKDPVKVP